MEKYSISDPNGLLVLVGSESDKGQPAFTFIKATDLFKMPRARDPAPRRRRARSSPARPPC